MTRQVFRKLILVHGQLILRCFYALLISIINIKNNIINIFNIIVVISYCRVANQVIVIACIDNGRENAASGECLGAEKLWDVVILPQLTRQDITA